MEYKILSYCRNRLWSFPVNLNTFEQLVGRPSTTDEMEGCLRTHRVPIENPKNSEEAILSQVGGLYEMFFKGYTVKPGDVRPWISTLRFAEGFPSAPIGTTGI